MSNRKIVVLKVLVWMACLYPLASLVYRAVFTSLGPDPTRTITYCTGLATIRLLVISLAITPLRRLSPRLSWLIRFRRLLGLFAFFYASLHLLTYVGLYSYFDLKAMAADILKRRYVTAGISAWLLLLPLALTSTKWSIRKLGKNWQKLHRLVYAAAILGVIHYWWLVKAGVRTPLTITVILAIVLLARPLTARIKHRSRAAAVSVST
ncbi:MAG TPA: protein-methionine-sulfoxide reductase heme-binding subunit MsrQ [Acidisarcina sp.]|nr:protein-methionine-sulfoxide reductase heme-binding subunit MsrQ [Acidisarcina sp.]